ncbi:hypothetical protein F5Y17DRAFT_454266 [Xylariaceae sp. FL0594]|nr:hypothetical protein F5Y17DRAFT_454266 [Xylariaceae sp. FL0594]
MSFPTKPTKKVGFHSPIISQVAPPDPGPEPLPGTERTRWFHSKTSENSSTCATIGTDDEHHGSPELVVVRTMGPSDRKKRKVYYTFGSDSLSDNNFPWARKEDAKLCAGREEGKSFKVLGAELGRSSKECRARYRQLLAHALALGLNDVDLAMIYPCGAENTPLSPGIQRLHFDSDYNSATDSDSSDEESGDDEDDDDEEEDEQAEYVKLTNAKTAKRDKGKDKAKVQVVVKAAKKKKKNDSNKTAKEKMISEMDGSSSSAPSSPSPDHQIQQVQPEPQNQVQIMGAEQRQPPNNPYDEEFWAQRRYFYDNVLGGSYPQRKILLPDDMFSASDCRILSNIEARYRSEKWLYIAAEFKNATNRTVDPLVLRAKFYGKLM